MGAKGKQFADVYYDTLSPFIHLQLKDWKKYYNGEWSADLVDGVT